MGKYINNIGTSYSEKIANLKEKHGATVTDSSFKENLVCVVNNGMFAAAGYAYCEDERNEFARQDGRPKTWLIVPEAKTLAL